jgi:hypothetical protein
MGESGFANWIRARNNSGITSEVRRSTIQLHVVHSISNHNPDKRRFGAPTNLPDGISAFLDEIHRFQFNPLFPSWIERVRCVMDDNGDCFHEETFHHDNSFQFCFGPPPATISLPLHGTRRMMKMSEPGILCLTG